MYTLHIWHEWKIRSSSHPAFPASPRGGDGDLSLGGSDDADAGSLVKAKGAASPGVEKRVETSHK